MVRRYHSSRSGGMSESASGSYVRVEDYEFLIAEIAYIKAGERARQVEETCRMIESAEKAERSANNG